MATVNPEEILQDELTCSVCLDYFKSPVSLDCGHNFCRACITEVWEGLDANFSCPECRKTSPWRNFKPNRKLRNITETAQKLNQLKCEKHKKSLEVFCKEDQALICVHCYLFGGHKEHTVIPIEEALQVFKTQMQTCLLILQKEREEIFAFKLTGEKESYKLLKQRDTERQKVVAEFKQLHQFLEEQERLLLAQLEELEKEIVTSRDEYVAKLSEEIASLNELIREIEEKCQQPASEFLQDIRSTLNRKIWEASKRNPFLESAMKTFKDALTTGSWFNEATVTLDPNTAHTALFLAEDRRSVRRRYTWKDVPQNPERFDSYPWVLGHERFSSGRHCWEVEMGEVGNWIVGVARESVSRKGELILNPEGGIWAVGLWEGQYRVLTSPKWTPLSRPPRRIRVCLDCAGGRVTFLDADTETPIFAFLPALFSGESIHPLLGVGDTGSQLRLCP
uniref:Zinc finger protein RFP-like n=1 Tax=Sphenodon punctatus TaxID=8508 RepID=A0A8D0H6U3_SPHPU